MNTLIESTDFVKQKQMEALFWDNYDAKTQTLFLSNKGLTDTDITTYLIPFLDKYPEITTLDVSINQIGDEGAIAIAANTILTALHVGFNKIGDEGAKALAANTVLTTLYAYYNKIGDEGAKALEANLVLTTLALDIDGNKMGAEYVIALAANPVLTMLDVGLDVSSNKIGAEGTIAFSEKSPLARYNAARNVGAKVGVPSLLDLSLFAIKQPRVQSQLSEDEKQRAQPIIDLEILKESAREIRL